MKLPSVNQSALVPVAVVLVGAALLYLSRRGVAGVASDLGSAAGTAVVEVAKGAAVGATDAVSTVIGIPTTQQVSDDPAMARWVLDNYGYLDAFNWFGPVTIYKAEAMDAGTGTQPVGDTALAKAHPKPANPDGAPSWLSSGWSGGIFKGLF